MMYRVERPPPGVFSGKMNIYYDNMLVKQV